MKSILECSIVDLECPGPCPSILMVYVRLDCSVYVLHRGTRLLPSGAKTSLALAARSVLPTH